MESKDKGRRTRRRSGEAQPSHYEKVAVSLPADLVQAIREQIRTRGVPSFSAYVAEAARKQLESNEFEDLLAEMFQEQPMTIDEEEWARRALYDG